MIVAVPLTPKTAATIHLQFYTIFRLFSPSSRFIFLTPVTQDISYFYSNKTRIIFLLVCITTFHILFTGSPFLIYWCQEGHEGFSQALYCFTADCLLLFHVISSIYYKSWHIWYIIREFYVNINRTPSASCAKPRCSKAKIIKRALNYLHERPLKLTHTAIYHVFPLFENSEWHNRNTQRKWQHADWHSNI